MRVFGKAGEGGVLSSAVARGLCVFAAGALFCRAGWSPVEGPPLSAPFGGW